MGRYVLRVMCCFFCKIKMYMLKASLYICFCASTNIDKIFAFEVSQTVAQNVILLTVFDDSFNSVRILKKPDDSMKMAIFFCFA